MTGCTIDGCEGVLLARGLCGKHYARLRRRGSTDEPPKRPQINFPNLDQYEVAADGCWLWTGRLDYRGSYGLLGRNRSAHRGMYEKCVGPIPEGMQLDHLCRVPRCVNPEHLKPVTNAENQRRRSLATTHCKRGHEYTPENTYRQPRGARVCRTCQALRRAELDAIRKPLTEPEPTTTESEREA